MRQIKISQIGYDPQYYPRVSKCEDWHTVHIYKEALVANPKSADSSAKPTKSWHPFPPITVVRVKGKPYLFMVLDGLHRLKAYTAAGFDMMWAVVETIPKSKWLARSVELNVPSQRGLDTGDKAWIAQRLKSEGWKLEKVAGLLQMKITSLEKIVVTRCHKLTSKDAKKIPEGRSNRRIDGASYGFVKGPFHEYTGTNKAIEVLEKQVGHPAANALDILDTFLTMLETDAFDRTNIEIASRLQRVEDFFQTLHPTVRV